jgi:beta-lactamase regulating signal transducer with metallopeptidase domain
MNVASMQNTWLTTLTQALGWTLVHFVWQGALIALVLFLFVRLARNRGPQIRYLAGCAALALMCGTAVATLIAETQAVQQELADSSNRIAKTLPSVPEITLIADEPAPQLPAATGLTRVPTNPVADMPLTASAHQAGQSQITATAFPSLVQTLPQQIERAAQRVEPYLPWIVCLWALGVVVFSLRLLAGWQAVRELRGNPDATDPLWIDRCHRLKTRLGVSYAVRLVFSGSAAVPMVIGWLKPVVLVPASLVAGLSAAQLEAILAHELIHIRRHDYLVNLVQNVVETVFFYHPAVAWVSNCIRVEREHCCDDAASLACGGTLDYARALAALAESQRAPVLGVAATGGSLVERIRRLAEAAIVPSRRGTSSAMPILFLLLAGLGTLGAIAGVSLIQPAAGGTKSPAANTVDANLPASAEQKDDVVTVRGRVLRPGGPPAAGARVSLRRHYWTSTVKWLPVAATTADGNGNFELSYRPSQFADNVGSDAKYSTIAAQAEGFGLQWAELRDVQGTEPVVITLVPEVPIHGRVIDLEGKPVEGVNVRLLYVREPKDGQDLGPWLATIKSGAMINAQVQTLGRTCPAADEPAGAPVITDRDGRFTFRGIGAERDARLELRGDSIAYRQLDIATRDVKPMKRQIWFYAGTGRPPITDQVFGANFTFEAAPTKPIVGTVRDRATGKPLADVPVESEHLAGMIVNPHNSLVTKTDANGHFRLMGMPKGNNVDMSGENVIRVAPAPDQPYFTRNFQVPDSPGVEAVAVDVGLARGQWITGRVTDQATGKPVSALINYFPFLDNPYAKPPEFRRDIFGGGGDDQRFHTQADGTYRLLGLPGRAIVGVWAMEGAYRKGVGASQIAGMDKNGMFRTYARGGQANAKFQNALKEVNAADGGQSTCDFALDSGASIRLRLVDRAGKPVNGAAVLDGSSNGSVTGSTVEVRQLALHEAHNVAIYHQGRQIGKYVVLKPDEQTAREMTVTLEPCATLVGKLVDDEGVPFEGVEVQASPAPGTYPYFFIPIVVSKADGTFECRGLFPGCDYGLVVHGSETKIQFPLKKIAIESGKTVDLGNVKLKRRPLD